MAAAVHWGILATGGIARKFARQLPESRTGRLAAVGSRTPARARAFAAEFGGIRAHASYAGLLGDRGVDAVYIAVPHPAHREWAIRAAEAGKHILCEKPLALNRADAAAMIDAARAHGVFLMEAFMYRCVPQTDALVQLIQAGAIGRLTAIEAAFRLDRPFDPAHRLFSRDLGGGGILDLGCYPVSFARRMAGAATGKYFAEPTHYLAAGRIHPAARTDEFARLSLKFAGGIEARLSCGTIGRHEVFARLHGTEGTVDVPAPWQPGFGGLPDHIFVRRRDDPELARIHCRAPRGLYALEADVVGECLAAGRPQAREMSWDDSLGNLAVLDAWRAEVGVRYPGE
ncbi:MAG TPA: Gfo/Idh/MocA family oxidoreductase [Opitutaceae bacterium]|nr:Gfo/Idh/MocA family oxidoreductase [Opitutaceae bacterium]